MSKGGSVKEKDNQRCVISGNSSEQNVSKKKEQSPVPNAGDRSNRMGSENDHWI